MNVNWIGAASSAFGVILAVWSLWYARVQSKRVSDLYRNEMISLWASLDRIRTLIWQVEKVTNDEGFVEGGELSSVQKQVLPQIFKGLCDEYVRIAQLIVQKTPGLTVAAVDRWAEMGRLKTPWQKAQFVNLIAAFDDRSSIGEG